MPRSTPSFDNAAFWNRRYLEAPNLGSGVGSRAENLRFKRGLIAAYLAEVTPTTILDIGCGDHEVLRDMDIPAYIGVDVSEVVVNRNADLFPDRRFVCLDFLKGPACDLPVCDVVFCFEVLIHQHDRADYDNFVRKLVRSSRKGGPISGYLQDPTRTVKSPIIAWHEPLTETLRRMGAENTKIVATSLETETLVFISFRAPACPL